MVKESVMPPGLWKGMRGSRTETADQRADREAVRHYIRSSTEHDTQTSLATAQHSLSGIGSQCRQASRFVLAFEVRSKDKAEICSRASHTDWKRFKSQPSSIRRWTRMIRSLCYLCWRLRRNATDVAIFDTQGPSAIPIGASPSYRKGRRSVLHQAQALIHLQSLVGSEDRGANVQAHAKFDTSF